MKDRITTMNDFHSPVCNKNSHNVHYIRSFVRRHGRLTKNQRRTIETCWPTMGLEYCTTVIDITALFDRITTTVLEIGFGMGASLITMAQNNPQQNFLGIEVYLPGLGACLAAAHESKINNLRVIYHDAIEVLQNMIPDNSLAVVQLFFPDPWQKTRHNKRRIVQTPFAKLVLQKLQIGGLFHMATDWQPYALHMLHIMKGIKEYRNISSQSDYLRRPDTRPITKFELRGQRLGHSTWDLMFEKQGSQD